MEEPLLIRLPRSRPRHKALRSEDREDTKEVLRIDWAGTLYEDRIKKKKNGNGTSGKPHDPDDDKSSD